MTTGNGKRPSVHVVLLNYNAWDKTLSCLASLSASEHQPSAVILIDNHSTDDRSAQVLSRYPRVEFIRNPDNLGFARGVNTGIRHALENGAEYIWLLNNDTVVDTRALGLMLERIEQADDIAIVGGQLREVTGQQRIQSLGGGRFNRWLGLVVHCKQFSCLQKIDYVNGANMFLRSEALHSVGLFDERYFMYWEDVDLSLRMRRAGWRLAIAPDAIVHHEVSGTVGRTSPLRRRLYLESADRFLRDYSPFPKLAIFVCRTVQWLIGFRNRVTDLAQDLLKRNRPL